MFQIDFYEDRNGYSEIEEYLKKLDDSNQRDDKKVLKKIINQLDMLALLGNQLHEPQAKFLKGYRHPIMELRPMPERIFYASWNKDRFVLLHHYTKKQNKTSKKEVEKALNNLDDWLERMDKNDNLE